MYHITPQFQKGCRLHEFARPNGASATKRLFSSGSHRRSNCRNQWSTCLDRHQSKANPFKMIKTAKYRVINSELSKNNRFVVTILQGSFPGRNRCQFSFQSGHASANAGRCCLSEKSSSDKQIRDKLSGRLDESLTSLEIKLSPIDRLSPVFLILFAFRRVHSSSHLK